MSKNSLRKIFFTCSFMLVLSSLTGCSFNKPIVSENFHNEQTQIDSIGNDSKAVKIADHLLEATFTNDFDWENATANELSGVSCSGIQNGQYRGRNYDWYYSDTDVCVVHTTKTENRPHASVGVSDTSHCLNDDGSVIYDQIPFTTVDGINDAGVCIQINVMPFGENGELVHTDDSSDDLYGGHVVRYVLDYADSVDDAIALLKEKDIYTVLYDAEELHWMISGPTSKEDSTTKTVVVEVFPDGLHVTENFIDNKPIMTNFNISNFDGTQNTVGLGQGYERWQILNENFNQADSVMGTFDLMEKVFYSKYYDLYGDRFWYSEFNSVNLSNIYDAEKLKELLGEEKYNYYMDNYGGVYYTSALWDGEKVLDGDTSKGGILADLINYEHESYKAQNMENDSLWITVHTAVYDLENKTLDLQVRESQDHLHFTID